MRTTAIHAGDGAPTPDFHTTNTPIYASTAFSYDDLETLDAVFSGERPGFVYSRHANPTVAAMEAVVAALEGTATAVAFGSGMAALHAALLAAGAESGATVVATQDLYGATRSLLASLFTIQGVRAVFVHATDNAALSDAVQRERPVALLVETISNPLLRIVDLGAAADIAHQSGACLIVDSTFASPVLCQPAAWGTDYVVHSATKYLAGHGDSTGGVVACAAERRDDLERLRRLVGGVLSPFEAWLTVRGIKTLPLRMRQHWENAAIIADWLRRNPAVETVHYPGLADHPHHERAKMLFRGGFGGMVSFVLRGAGKSEVFDWFRRLGLIVPATTLGDVGSLALYPAISSHRGMTAQERNAVGITDGLIRLAVGIEEADDIIADLAHAFGG